MRSDIRKGWFDKCTSLKKIKKEYKRHRLHYDRIYNIYMNARIYNIRLSDDSLYDIANKLGHHQLQMQKLYNFKRFFEKGEKEKFDFKTYKVDDKGRGHSAKRKAYQWAFYLGLSENLKKQLKEEYLTYHRQFKK